MPYTYSNGGKSAGAGIARFVRAQSNIFDARALRVSATRTGAYTPPLNIPRGYAAAAISRWGSGDMMTRAMSAASGGRKMPWRKMQRRTKT